MNHHITFDYETVRGETLEVSGRTDGSKVKFIAYLDGNIAPKSILTTIDVRNIEEFILDNSEPEVDYYDLDYRDER
jgi:hypothetical protein